MKKFTSFYDHPAPSELIRDAIQIKSGTLNVSESLKGKTIGLVFLNPSLRTRLSTIKAAQMLGMHPVVMNADSEGWCIEWNDHVVMNGRAVEHIKEAAMVLGTYCDVVGIRCFPGLNDREYDYSEFVLKQMLKYCPVPVLSLESATRHPLQSLADCITIIETWSESRKPNVVLAWAPHIKALPQAVPNSFAEWTNGLQMNLTIAHPKGYELSETFSQNAAITNNLDEALEKADFVYFKNWSALNPYGGMPEVSENWLVSSERHDLSGNPYIMHCLPVRRDIEVSAELLDHPKSLIAKQAENRLYAALAAIRYLSNP